MKKFLIAVYKLLVSLGMGNLSAFLTFHILKPANGLAFDTLLTPSFALLVIAFILLELVFIAIVSMLVTRVFTHHPQTKEQGNALTLILCLPFVFTLAYTLPATITLALNPMPTQAREVRPQAAGNPGDLVWQNFRVASGSIREVTRSVYQTQSDGTFRAVSAQDGLRCNILSGANTVSVDIRCTELAGLSPGCAKVKAEIDGKSVNAIIRVTNPDGSGEYCPQ